MNSIFCQRFRELREEKNLSQIALGKILGFSQATIAKWESGDRAPTIFAIITIADYFDCSLDYLLGRRKEY